MAGNSWKRLDLAGMAGNCWKGWQWLDMTGVAGRT